MVKVVCWELNKVFDTVTCNIFLSKPRSVVELRGQPKALHGLACAEAVPYGAGLCGWRRTRGR